MSNDFFGDKNILHFDVEGIKFLEYLILHIPRIFWLFLLRIILLCFYDWKKYRILTGIKFRDLKIVKLTSRVFDFTNFDEKLQKPRNRDQQNFF